ncbi:hypothetical protein QWJ07_31405 [Frankia sp. RB7]|nr:hypothetical protein [Frankia sp. RB7]
MTDENRQSPAETVSHDGREWRCFFCDEVFTDPKAAGNHFGCDHPGNEPLCQLAQVDGGIARVIADLSEELQRYRSEDNESFREFYRLGADHVVALRNEEQKGYDRGLADGRKEVREDCAKIADAMADDQQATNEKYPDHARAYPSWRSAIQHYRSVADRIRNPRAATEQLTKSQRPEGS